jgi:hypothetical protein
MYILRTIFSPRDRLGTNIGETQQKEAFILQAAQARIFNQVSAMLRDAFNYSRSHLGFQTAVGCEKRHFLRHLCIKTNILPRQARDKHRENSQKSGVLCRCAMHQPY